MSSKSRTSATPAAPAQPRLTLWHVQLALIAIGIFIAGYLSYTELTQTSIVCVEGDAFNCDLVQSSIYSTLGGVPVAYLGLLTYLVLLGLVVGEKRVPFLKTFGVTLQTGIILFGFLFSMWLVYVQVVLLQALCPWCLAHELVMTVMMGVTGFRQRNHLRD